MSYMSPLVAPHFAATKSAEEIAKRLQDDEALIYDGQPCSWVAWHLQGYDTPKGRAVAEYLAPARNVSHAIKNLIYDNLLKSIRRHLEDDRVKGHSMKTSLALSDVVTTLKVITRLQELSVIQKDTSAEAITLWLEQQLNPRVPPHKARDMKKDPVIPKSRSLPRKRLCYICRITNTSPYPAQPSMCIPCGAFNSSSSLLSMPGKLSLPTDFVALVTGARVNLGYHTVLRLLRCGARVIATSRYPRDAVVRYLNEHDSAKWNHKLRIVGADFRSASDAFSLVRETKSCLKWWGGESKLCLLVNSAAQTLTDSIEKEERAICLEDTLREKTRGQLLLVESDYTARVRGGAAPMLLERPRSFEALASREIHAPQTKPGVSEIGPSFAHDRTPTDLDVSTKSSWVQSIFEIPYEDVMSAHAVNTFVPLILCRELLPIMGRSDLASPPISGKPQGYIVNVSSREGIFEDRTKSTAKGGKHVHTNMSKAALNMITETEAAAAWQSRRVAMNTVDPGYMSAAPECEDAFEGMRPIGWEDGTGRVLWPVALSEVEGEVVWGRFLKHYGAVQVDPGAGRG